MYNHEDFWFSTCYQTQNSSSMRSSLAKNGTRESTFVSYVQNSVECFFFLLKGGWFLLFLCETFKSAS